MLKWRDFFHAYDGSCVKQGKECSFQIEDKAYTLYPPQTLIKDSLGNWYAVSRTEILQKRAKGNEAVQKNICAVGVKVAAKIDPKADIPSVWLTMTKDKLPYPGTYAYAIKTLAGNVSFLQRDFLVREANNTQQIKEFGGYFEHEREDGKISYKVITPKAHGTELYKLLTKDGCSFITAINISVMLFKALYELHVKKGFLHLDIKPENIFVITEGEDVSDIEFIDFAFSTKYAGSPVRIGFCAGDMRYIAPEILKQRVEQRKNDSFAILVDDKADVFAAAMLVYYLIIGDSEIMTKRASFADAICGIINDDTCNELVSDQLEAFIGASPYGKPLEYIRGKLATYWAMQDSYFGLLSFSSTKCNNFIEKLKEIIDGCTNPDPKKRFSAEQAFKKLEELRNLVVAALDPSAHNDNSGTAVKFTV